MAKRCQRNACGKDYTDEENADGACKHHPGTPIFHEGLKGWSCCPKRFTDFGDFLSWPGCTTGSHSDVKAVPAEDKEKEEKAEKEKLEKEKSESVRLSHEARAKVRARSMDERLKLPVTVTASLSTALEAQRAQEKKQGESQVVEVGQACTNNACKGRFVNEESHSEECVFHPGQPVFHEGMKYWSCCSKKKTHDFDEFLALPGCTKGTHRWFKPKEDLAKAKACRYDFIQTAEHVVVSVFAKCIEPEKSSVTANKDSIVVSILYGEQHTFTLDLHLWGDILPEASAVTLMSTKMDIKIKKASAENWPTLTHQ